MQYRQLGSTGLSVSAVSFGAGPVPALMTTGEAGLQIAAVRRALAAGVNWFDTAATYGDGASESGLGAALAELNAAGNVHVATKVRLMPPDRDDVPAAVRRSVDASLRRLRLKRVTLLQLHNSITDQRDQLHTSITPDDVLRPGGVLAAFEDLKRDGLVDHFGLTALGQPGPLRRVLDSRAFATVQLSYNLLDARAPGSPGRGGSGNGGGDGGEDLLSYCTAAGVGVFAIRVFAGGALAGKPPSRHTLTTRFFPLALYESDARRAEGLAAVLPAGLETTEAAVRFVLSHPGVSSALVGFSSADEVDQAVRYAEAGPLPPACLEAIARAAVST